MLWPKDPPDVQGCTGRPDQDRQPARAGHGGRGRAQIVERKHLTGRSIADVLLSFERTAPMKYSSAKSRAKYLNALRGFQAWRSAATSRTRSSSGARC